MRLLNALRSIALTLVVGFGVVPSALSAFTSNLSPLAVPPDWERLEPYQATLTLEEFRNEIDLLYAPGDAFWRYTAITDNTLQLFSDEQQTQPLWALRFAESETSRRSPPQHRWTRLQLEATAERPLAGLRICLDPGHIGGEFAKLEERWFQLGNDNPIVEWDLNLLAARHAERLLVAQGAEVVWTKNEPVPLTPLRPSDLREEAIRTLFFVDGWKSRGFTAASIESRIARRAEGLFYRTAEIRSRAQRVAELDVDLTLCIHFNAAPWGGAPSHKRLVPESRLVVFVHGQYSATELAADDQKFELLLKLLERSHPRELAVAQTIAGEMERVWQLPPERYERWDAVRRIGPSPYVFARNLLANRTFPGPVIFVEGPYMNARDAYARLEAGDYEGTREINGRQVRSIFVEYGEILAAGVLRAATIWQK